MPKNPGIKLSFEQLGEQVQIPREFIAAMELKETVQAVPNEVEADALSDTVIFSRIETNRINERVKHTWFKKPGNIILLDYTTEQDGQLTQTTRTLFPTAGVMPKPTGNQKFTVHDLGNGWSIQEVSVEGFFDDSGQFVPKVFLGARYEARIPDPLPPEFAIAIPVKTTETNVAGTAAFQTPDVLVSDELVHWEQQVDTYIKRVHSENRKDVVLPLFLYGIDTNDRKQVVTVQKKYKTSPLDGGASNPLPTAFATVTVEPLGGPVGDRRELETVRSVDPPVLLSERFTVEVEDGIPMSFKATVPRTTTEVTKPGNVIIAPTLGTNELSREVENVDLYTNRSRVTTRPAISGAQSGKEWRGPRDGEGSEFTSKVQKSSTLGANTLDVSTGQFILDSKVTPVSPTQSLLETSTAPSFPILTETIQDKRTRFKLTRTKSIVDNTFVPVTPLAGTFYQTRALDSERSELIQETVVLGIDGSGIADVYQQFDGMIDVQLPVQLLTVTGIANTVVGEADYVDKGYAFTAAGNGTASIHGHANCKAVAGVTTDVSYTVRDPWGRDVPCTHYLFPVIRTNANLRSGAHITIFNANMGPLGAPNLLAWPKFAPESVNIVCASQRVSAQGEVDGAYSQMTVVDYLGAVKFNGFQKYAGAGGDVEIETSTKVVRLPPTIHGSIVIKQPTGSVGSVPGSTVLAPKAHGGGTFIMGTGPINPISVVVTADVPSPDGTTGKVVGSILADNGVLPLSGTIDAVAQGVTTIPTIGSYLYKFFAEPYDYDYLLLHYIVVDMADIK